MENRDVRKAKDALEEILYMASMMYMVEPLDEGKNTLLSIGHSAWDAAVAMFGEQEAQKIEDMAKARGIFFLEVLKVAANGTKTKC